MYAHCKAALGVSLAPRWFSCGLGLAIETVTSRATDIIYDLSRGKAVGSQPGRYFGWAKMPSHRAAGYTEQKSVCIPSYTYTAL